MLKRLSNSIKALKALGPEQVSLFALYQAGKLVGLWKSMSRQQPEFEKVHLREVLSLPSREELLCILGDQVQPIYSEADEIVAGQVRLFGGPPVPLNLKPLKAEYHWSAAEQADLGGDIKFIWEPARFGWAFTLAQAYFLSGDKKYFAAYWQYFEEFQASNLPYQGPNWASGQEAALRILAFAFCAHIFPLSEKQQQNLAEAIAVHASRIPPTLLYARAQHNNHLLTEAAGLYTAGLLLADLPSAKSWRELGWKWLNRGLQTQIAEDGTYAQHSTNYHRLMLQAALWCDALARSVGDEWPLETRQRLAGAARWLAALLDQASGDVPNLGHNDGACILPLGSGAFRDYRPVVQAAAFAFLGQPALPEGLWDVLAAWLGFNRKAAAVEPPLESPAVHRLNNTGSWATLRAVQFCSRPAHADQLHVDLWWKGANILCDPGTYCYNAPPPWDNGLARTAVHNTITVEGRDAMTRTGRFLWLDWSQARVLGKDNRAVTADHDGYRSIGITHRRSLESLDERHWRVRDRLLPAGRPPDRERHITLHWLLQDGKWTLDGQQMSVSYPFGTVRLAISGLDALKVEVVRAGIVLHGESFASDLWGWYSPTYNVRLPALSFLLTFSARLPVDISTHIHLDQS